MADEDGATLTDEDGATLADVMPGEAASVVEQAMEPTLAAEPQPVIDAQGRSYATGKRKNAVARVWLKPGSGKYTMNGRDWETYFARPTLRMIINESGLSNISEYRSWRHPGGGFAMVNFGSILEDFAVRPPNGTSTHVSFPVKLQITPF